MREPELSLDQAKAKVETLTAPRVTVDSIKERIRFVDYLYLGNTTVCLMTMVNDFKVIGHSTPASSANYNKEVGERYAYENAFKQLWQLEAYLLRERLYKESGQ